MTMALGFGAYAPPVISGEAFVVTVSGRIAVEATVAVIAESEEEASRLALSGLRVDTKEWLHQESHVNDPVATDVTRENELRSADQKHLVSPKSP